MLTYDLKTGYSCNNRCRHCVIDDSRLALKNRNEALDLTTDECLEKIQHAASMGATNIVLTGGEVTIRKDLAVLMHACVDKHMAITLQTNGRRLTHESIRLLLAEGLVSRCIVALHGATSAIHDHITQINGSFEETLASLKMLAENNITTIIKVVISKININELVAIAQLSKSVGMKYICYAFPHAHGAARQNFDEIVPTYSSLVPQLRELVSFADSNDLAIEFEAIPFCVVPFGIHMVGEMKYYNGNVVCSPVGEELFDWGKVRPSIKYKPETCGECDFNEFCEGVWQEYTKILVPGELPPLLLPKEQRSQLKEILRKMKTHYTK